MMMTNRSNHIPMLIRMATLNRKTGLLRTDLHEENQRCNDIAETHDPEKRRIVADYAKEKGLSFDYTSAIPRNERLNDVSVADDNGHDDGCLGDLLQRIRSDDLLETEDAPQGDEKRQYHGKTRMNGPGHEVRWQNSAVITRYDSQRKIP